MSNVTFNSIQIGRKFKVASGIVYQKTSTKQAKPIQKADGTAIINGKIITSFYNSPIKVTQVT